MLVIDHECDSVALPGSSWVTAILMRTTRDSKFLRSIAPDHQSRLLAVVHNMPLSAHVACDTCAMDGLNSGRVRSHLPALCPGTVTRGRSSSVTFSADCRTDRTLAAYHGPPRFVGRPSWFRTSAIFK